MKKERNAFFSNYTAQNTSYIPNIPNNMPIPNMQQPYIPTETNIYGTNELANYNDIDNRLNKLERVVNRLDSRVTALENKTHSIEQTPSNNCSNMYML